MNDAFASVLVSLIYAISGLLAIFWFKSPIQNALSAVTDRVAKGANLNLGSLNIGSPVTEEGKQKKAEEELAEEGKAAGQAFTRTPEGQASTSFEAKPPLSVEQILRFEDLALSRFEQEIGTPIKRSVKIGGVIVDGLVDSDMRFVVIEAKIYSGNFLALDPWADQLRRIARALNGTPFDDICELVLLVINDTDQLLTPSDIRRAVPDNLLRKPIQIRVMTRKTEGW